MVSPVILVLLNPILSPITSKGLLLMPKFQNLQVWVWVRQKGFSMNANLHSMKFRVMVSPRNNMNTCYLFSNNLEFLHKTLPPLVLQILPLALHILQDPSLKRPLALGRVFNGLYILQPDSPSQSSIPADTSSDDVRNTSSFPFDSHSANIVNTIGLNKNVPFSVQFAKCFSSSDSSIIDSDMCWHL
ncbi:uncharacterized protein LOC107854995 [Capsicum annuum]|uniref:uncharacterized protein LOC107854995 n=1 Tax=Capsicum annuum TaxID=4072 RepID=UPI001FB0DF89|nr:uncharacterized protein LOC107854995 [Capsicum annuum]